MDSSSSDTPHRSKPRRRSAAAGMPGFMEGNGRRSAGYRAHGTFPFPAFCRAPGFFSVFSRAAAGSACLPLLGGCAAGRGAAEGSVWFWGGLLAVGLLAFGILSFRMRDETAENGASGVFPALLSNRSCGLFRISPPTEEGLSLSAYASDPALIDEVLLRACDRGADILLAPAPVDTADGESDAAFDEPLPSSGVSAFSDELEASLAEPSPGSSLLRGICLQTDPARFVIRTDEPLDEREWHFWAGPPCSGENCGQTGVRGFLRASGFSVFQPDMGRASGTTGRSAQSGPAGARRTRPAPAFSPYCSRTGRCGSGILGLAGACFPGPPELPPENPFWYAGARRDAETMHVWKIFPLRGWALPSPRGRRGCPPDGHPALSLRRSRGKPLTLWLGCSLRHVTICADGVRRAHAVLGYALEAWSPWEQGQDFRKELDWRPAAPGGDVPPLLRWVLRDMAARHPLRPRFFNLQTPGASLGR